MIADDEIDHAINLLMKQDVQKENLHELVYHSSRFTHLQKAYNGGLLAWNEYVIEKNKIVVSLLSLIKDEKIQAEEINTSSSPINPQTKNNKPYKRGILRLGIVTSMILLLGLGYMNFVLPQSVSDQQLIAQYYHQPLIEQTRFVDNSNHSDFHIALQAVARHEYPQAIELLEAIGPNDPKSNYAAYLLSSIYLQTEQAAKAIIIMEELIKSDDQLFTESLEWNLALAYLSLCKDTRVNPYFRKILNHPEHVFHKEAKQLSNLIKLNKPI